MEKMDIMAFGAHPDDVELGAAGTLIKHAAKGQQIIIVDLTEGELGSRGSVEERYQEAAESAKIMGVAKRVNLKMKDGFVTNSEENKMKVIEIIRQYRPRIIIIPASKDRHPDHGSSHELISQSFFLSGLTRIKTETPAFRPKIKLSYLQDQWIEPDIIVDITNQFPIKLKAIAAYQTQFYQENDSDQVKTKISTMEFWDNIEARARSLGHRIGAKYAESFMLDDKVGITDLDSIYIPEYS